MGHTTSMVNVMILAYGCEPLILCRWTPMTKKTRPAKIVKNEWPPEAIEEMKRLHRANKKASTILGLLLAGWPDYPFTRNAVMGKIWRLGLTNVNSNKQTPRGSKAAVREKAAPIAWTPAMDAAIVRDYGLGRQPGRIAELLHQEHKIVTTRHAVRQRLITLGRYKQPGDTPPSGRGVVSRTATPPKHLVIVEDLPHTSVAMESTSYEKGHCQYPTSDDMKMVCGSAAVTGSYCQRHAAIVYRSPPTGKRVATFRRVNEYFK